MKSLAYFIYIIIAISLTTASVAQQKTKAKTKQSEANTVLIQNISPVDTSAVERITGIKGKYSN
ncbi:MAG: hypothetical protein ACXVLT_11065, partial [Flavisolibacter sp.]